MKALVIGAIALTLLGCTHRMSSPAPATTTDPGYAGFPPCTAHFTGPICGTGNDVYLRWEGKYYPWTWIHVCEDYWPVGHVHECLRKQAAVRNEIEEMHR